MRNIPARIPPLGSSILFGDALFLYYCWQVELHVLALANVRIGEERVARKMIHRAMVQVLCQPNGLWKLIYSFINAYGA